MYSIRNVFPSIIICLFYSCRIFFLFSGGAFKAIYPFLFGLFAFFYLLFVGQRRWPFIFFLFAVTLLYLNTWLGGYYMVGFFRPVIPASYLLLALLLINSDITEKSIDIPFYIFILIYIILVFFLSKDPNNIFVGNSRNTVSSILLEMGVLLQITRIRNCGNVVVFPAVLVFLLSLSAIGRSGIITSAMFLCIILLEKLIHAKSKVKFIFAIMLFVLCFLCFFHDIIVDFLSYIRNKGINYSTDPRNVLLKEYLRSMDNSIKYFLFGVNQFDTSLVFFHKLNNNWHNSFLSLHSRFTLLGFILVCLFYFSSIFYAILRGRIYLVYLGFCLVLSLRMFTDSLAFSGSMDVVLFYLFYLILSPGSSVCLSKSSRNLS